MRTRFVEFIRPVRPVKCAATLLVIASVLFFVVLPMTLAQAADVATKPPSLAALFRESCRVDPPNDWSEPERWAWKEICEGRSADFNSDRRAMDLNPKDSDVKPEILDLDQSSYDDTFLTKRTLSALFLQTIIINEPFRSAITHRGVHIVGAYFGGNTDLTDASIEWPLELAKSFFTSRVLMDRFATSKFVSFAGSTLKATLDMNEVSIDGNLSIRNVKCGGVALRGAEIGGHLFLHDSKFEDTVNLTFATIGGSLLMRTLTSEGIYSDVLLEGAKIDRHMSMSGAKFRGTFDVRSASVRGDVLMRGAKFNKPLNLSALKVGSDFDLQGATLRGLDLTGTRIEGALKLGSLQHKKIEWTSYNDDDGNGESRGPKLTLRNTSVDVLQDTQDAWPLNLELELDGFTYSRLGVGREERLYMRGSKWFVDWLAKDKSYSPQPYQQLARVLGTAGLHSIADKVLYTNREREREDSGWGWWSFLTVNWLVFGYGYGLKSLWTLVWAGVFVVLGTAILVIHEERHKKEALGFWYSLDMLLPVIHLREAHYEADLENKWVRRYFYVHKILGYVLTSLLFAGLSGLTKYVTD